MGVHLSGFGLYAEASTNDVLPDQDAAVERKKEVVALHFDFGPEDDVGLQVMEACEKKGLSEDGCEAVMQQVGNRFSDYQGSARAQLASMTFSQAFARLFGMRRKDGGSPGDDAPFESFAVAAEAAYSSDSFVDIGAWWRYQEMVGEALADEADYAHFADEPAFHFTCPYWTWGDAQAAELAAQVCSHEQILKKKANISGGSGDSHEQLKPSVLVVVVMTSSSSNSPTAKP